jgi:hypothetical protein
MAENPPNARSPGEYAALTRSLRTIMVNLRCVERELSKDSSIDVREMRSYLHGIRSIAGEYVNVPEQKATGDETGISRDSMRLLLIEHLPRLLGRLAVSIEVSDDAVRRQDLLLARNTLVGLCVTVDQLLLSPTLALRDTLPGLGASAALLRP